MPQQYRQRAAAGLCVPVPFVVLGFRQMLADLQKHIFMPYRTLDYADGLGCRMLAAYGAYRGLGGTDLRRRFQPVRCAVLGLLGRGLRRAYGLPCRGHTACSSYFCMPGVLQQCRTQQLVDTRMLV